MVLPQLGENALACDMRLRISSDPHSMPRKWPDAYLRNDVPQLLLDLLLRPLKPLPQLVSHTPPRQQVPQCGLLVPDQHDAIDVLGGPLE